LRTLDADDKQRLSEMRPTLRELLLIDVRRDYEAIRKGYFGKSIPTVDEVAIVMLPQAAIGSILKAGYNCEGFSISSKVKRTACAVICISEDGDDTDTRHTLIHEMAHLKVDGQWKRNMGHGKVFQKEIKRLVAAGAYDGWL
jgi:hypothetical protein